MTSQRTLLIIAALAAGMCTEATAAKKRVVVLDVEGARNKKLERSLTDLVGEEATVLPGATYRKEARKLKATKLSPEQVARVAARMDADGVLESLIVADKGRYVLRIRLHEGTSGRTIKKIALKLRSPALSGKMEDALAERLSEAIADLQPLESIEASDGDPDEDAAADDEEEEQPAPPPKKKKAAPPRRVASADDGDAEMGAALEVSDPNEGDEPADADADSDADADADADEPAAEVSGSSRASHAPGEGAAVGAGVSVIQRKLAFNARADMTNPPLGYSGAPVPAATVGGELYPMVLAGRSGALTNLGVGFAAHKGIGLKTNVTVNDAMVSLPTDETYYGIDVRYRHKLGRRMQLVGSLGWAALSFTIDRANGEVAVPDSSYRYYQPGLEVRYAASPRMTLAADARIFLVTASGAIGTAEEYGAAKMTGGEGGAGVEVLWGKRLVTRVGARVLMMAYQFQGTGMQTNARDGDPTSVDIGGALDRYLCGELSAGYLF
ncbi:MAG TPA: hypothetical protein VL172_06745 [Kofleriaceae bacterium]|nr:hypothetical protein [Kofleriaceae bacterium]